MKILLILSDGTRPDSLEGIEFIEKLKRESTYCMAAQTVTPMFSGLLMDKLGMTSLFPYATVFVALAFVTMLFVMHGDNKPVAKKGLEALDVED